MVILITCFKAATPQPAGTLTPQNGNGNQVPFRGQSLPRAFPGTPKATTPAPEINFDRFGQYGKTPERPKFKKQRSIADLLCTSDDAQPPPPPKEPKWGQAPKKSEQPLYNPFARDNERKSVDRTNGSNPEFSNGNRRDATDFVQPNNYPMGPSSISNNRNQLPPKPPTIVKPMGVNYVQIAIQDPPKPPGSGLSLQVPSLTSPSMSHTSTPTPPPLPTP